MIVKDLSLGEPVHLKYMESSIQITHISQQSDQQETDVENLPHSTTFRKDYPIKNCCCAEIGDETILRGILASDLQESRDRKMNIHVQN